MTAPVLKWEAERIERRLVELGRDDPLIARMLRLRAIVRRAKAIAGRNWARMVALNEELVKSWTSNIHPAQACYPAGKRRWWVYYARDLGEVFVDDVADEKPWNLEVSPLGRRCFEATRVWRIHAERLARLDAALAAVVKELTS